jgi:hypothetical protein
MSVLTLTSSPLCPHLCRITVINQLANIGTHTASYIDERFWRHTDVRHDLLIGKVSVYSRFCKQAFFDTRMWGKLGLLSNVVKSVNQMGQVLLPCPSSIHD